MADDKKMDVVVEELEDGNDFVPATEDLPVVAPRMEAKEGEVINADTPAVITPENKERKGDIEYVRSNLYLIIEKGQEALSELVEVARSSEHPRAYEVLSTQIKTISDATRDLLDLHIKISKLERDERKAAIEESSEGDSGPDSVTNNNTIFVGTTEELLAAVKALKKK